MSQALPTGVRLLHIGPHKTGTTTLQAAFHHSREALRAQGVLYAGRNAHPMAAAMAAATGRALETSQPTAGERRWRDLVQEVRDSDARVTVVSSEFFSDAPAARIPGIVAELDPDRTHVVVTLRPLVRILASQWQQYMQNRPAVRYDDRLDYPGWLHAVLDDPDSRAVTPSFWQRHRHDQLVGRWADAVGADRLTVVVVDDSDKGQLLRSFEELLDVRPATLAPATVSANRSLTFPEVQMLCAFNRAYLDAGWSTPDYTRFVRFGAVRFLQERTPASDEPRLLTPQWAVDRASEISGGMVAGIRATGVRVVGDLDSLADPAVASGVGDNDPTGEIPAEITARFMAGLVKHLAEVPAQPAPESRTVGPLESTVRGDKRERRAEREHAATQRRLQELTRELSATRPVGELSRTELVGVVAGRARRRLTRAARALGAIRSRQRG